jgi:hypothetical protein
VACPKVRVALQEPQRQVDSVDHLKPADDLAAAGGD